MNDQNIDAAPALPFPQSFDSAVRSLIAKRLRELADYDLKVCHFIVVHAGAVNETIEKQVGFPLFESEHGPGWDGSLPDSFHRSVQQHHQFLEVSIRSPEDETAYVLIIRDECAEVDPEVSDRCYQLAQ